MGNRRALAKIISIVEDEREEKRQVLRRLYQQVGRAYVVGITGAPGAGKSSLVDKLTGEIRKQGLTVGIIAVDPTSPFTGGALLGDRIRMQSHTLDEGVFIRSMGTRGSLGGLAKTSKEAIKVLDAFGMDMVLVETVGVGQSELDVMNAVDTTVVVLTPGSGDVIQTMKAGIMEIADVFAVNKADLEGVQQLILELENMLSLDTRPREWRPPIVPVISLTGEGIPALLKAIQDHQKYLETSGKLAFARQKRLRNEVIDLALEQMRTSLKKKLQAKGELEELMEEVVQRKIDPYTAAEQIVQKLGENNSGLRLQN